jgi:hypothetical protein
LDSRSLSQNTPSTTATHQDFASTGDFQVQNTIQPVPVQFAPPEEDDVLQMAHEDEA